MLLSGVPNHKLFLRNGKAGLKIANNGDVVVCALEDEGIVQLPPATEVESYDARLGQYVADSEAKVLALYAENAALHAEQTLKAGVTGVNGQTVTLKNVEVFAESFADILAREGGTDYLDLELSDPHVVVTVRRPEGRTPHELKLSADARAARYRKAMTKLEQLTNPNHPAYIEDQTLLLQEVRNIVDDTTEQAERDERAQGELKYLSELERPLTKAPFDEATARLIEERKKQLEAEAEA